MPPIEYVHLTADLGCRYITTGMVGFAPVKALNYPPFSLRDEPRLRRDLLAAMDDRGVSISLGEGLLIAPGVDVRSYAADLDVMAELRIPRINTVSLEPDRARTFDELAALTALAAERGIATCVEPVVGLSIADLPIGHRRGGVRGPRRDQPADRHHARGPLRRVARRPAGHSRRADRLHPTERHHDGSARMPHYAEEAMFERMAPGEGELPLVGHARGAAGRSRRRFGDTDAIARRGRRQRLRPAYCRASTARGHCWLQRDENR